MTTEEEQLADLIYPLMAIGPLWFTGCDGSCFAASMTVKEEQHGVDLDFVMASNIFHVGRGGVTKS